MGILGFKKWLANHCPLCILPFASMSRPEIDNFYIDFTSIIYRASETCIRGNSFEEYCENTINETLRILDSLVQIVKPQNLVFISIDGVPPLAKSIKRRKFLTIINQSEIKGLIFPGSDFMDNIHQKIDRFIKKKTKSDSCWMKPQVVYSSIYIPGEAEHKIIQFIRTDRRKAVLYQANDVHCVFSPDSDLIALLLQVPEKYVCLMYWNEILPYCVSEHDYNLIMINILKEYFLRNNQPHDITQISKDWTLILFNLGNDYIKYPHQRQKFQLKYFENSMKIYSDYIMKQGK